MRDWFQAVQLEETENDHPLVRRHVCRNFHNRRSNPITLWVLCNRGISPIEKDFTTLGIYGAYERLDALFGLWRDDWPAELSAVSSVEHGSAKHANITLQQPTSRSASRNNPARLKERVENET